jgi:hypothetical protein
MNLQGAYLTLDSGFDNAATRNEILFRGLIPVIKPNLRGLKSQKKIDKILDEFERVETIYKERYRIERCFAWEDAYRKLVTRYEKLQSTFMGFRYVAYSMINFRELFGKNGRQYESPRAYARGFTIQQHRCFLRQNTLEFTAVK